jgi:rhamnopyranosyl-N-acetylglucosaminyl-diphospho-decaprenol beta-1,3/1,4-galactofuranosyltransferase
MYIDKSRKEKVVAITVTYNRIHTLRKCLSALLNQSIAVDEIIVVDNNSCEDEKKQINDMVMTNNHIHLVSLDDNLGGAGGFEAGMKAAAQFSPDWYWLMDDDAYPREDCLKSLLSYGKILPDVGGVCPAIYGVDLERFQLYHHKKLSRLMLKNSPVGRKYEDLGKITEEDANAFVGPLFPKKVVDELGIADGSLFIYGDDTEYTYRISRKYKLYLIKDAIINHQDAPVTSENMSPKGWWKEYYCNRNQYFMIRKFHRNAGIRYLAFGLYTARLTAIIIKSRLMGYHGLRSRMIIKSMRDGFKNHRGKTVDPQKYLLYLQRENIN